MALSSVSERRIDFLRVIRRESKLPNIGITCPCNVYSFIPHFYIAKQGYTGLGLLIFLIFIPKYRLWVLVRTVSARRF